MPKDLDEELAQNFFLMRHTEIAIRMSLQTVKKSLEFHNCFDKLAKYQHSIAGH